MAKSLRIRDRRVRRIVVGLLCLVSGLAFYRVGLHVWGGYRRAAAEDAIERRDFAAARTELQRCLWVWPSSAELHLLAARTARRQRDIAAAQQHLESSQRHGGLEEAITLERRLIGLQSGKLDDADEFFQYCVKAPDREESLLTLEALIEGSIASLDLKRANTYIDQWEKQYPGASDQAQAHLWRSFLYELTRDQDSALAECKQAVELDPENKEARVALVGALLNGLPDEALSHLDFLVQRYPDDAHVLYLKAKAEHNLGRLDAANKSLDQALVHGPDDVESLVLRGKIALQMQQTEAAGRWLRRAERLSPKHREVLLAMIDYHRARGQPEEVARYQDRMREIEEGLKRGIGAGRPDRPDK